VWSPSLTSSALFLAGWSCGWFLLWRSRRLPAARPADTAVARPSMAVVVPARDEERTLPTLLVSVLPQLRQGDVCVVVDDESSDATVAVAEAAGALVRSAGPRPGGWTGKAWACANGANAPDVLSCELLVFLDADVRLDGGDVLDRLAAEVGVAPDVLVSVQPWHRTVRPVEQLSVFFNITALMGSTGFTALGRRVRSSLAFGPVLACRRAAYEAAGGHAHPSVRGAVAEDIALARRFRTVSLHTGWPDVSFRMYPDGLRSLVQGWTKNIASGAASVRWWFAALVVGWMWSLNGGWITSPWFYAASAAQVLVLGRRAGRFGLLTALAYPVLVLFFLVVFLRSVALTALRRPARWKGRLVAPR
jgi:4,4'-diaponeurosporenoate glycosyltransferase